MLISDKIAVVPTGISCITGFQVSRLREKFSERFNCDFTSTSSFFRYLFQEPSKIPTVFNKFVHNNRDIRVEDIRFEKHEQRCPYLPETGSWFIHESAPRLMEDRGIMRDEADIPQHVASKYNYLLEKLRRLREIEKRIFIFGNADLEPRTWPRYYNGSINWHLKKDDIANTCSAIQEAYPTGENIFIFVGSTYNILDDVDTASTFFLNPANNWQGDDAAWDRIFQKFPSAPMTKEETRLFNKEQVKILKTFPKFYNANSPDLYIRNDCVSRNEQGFKIYAASKNSLIWGPYIRLTNGLYEVTVDFDEIHFEGTGYLKITQDSGEYLTHRVFDFQDIRANKGKIIIRFCVGFDMHEVETVIETPESLFCTLKSISIKRMF